MVGGTHNSIQPPGFITAIKQKCQCQKPDRSNYIFKETLSTWGYWLHLVNDSAIQTATVDHMGPESSIFFQWHLKKSNQPTNQTNTKLSRHNRRLSKISEGCPYHFFITMLAAGPPLSYFPDFWCSAATMTCLWGLWARFGGRIAE